MEELIVKDLAELINKWDLDRKASTPDFILAQSVYDYIEDFININKQIKNETIKLDSY